MIDCIFCKIVAKEIPAKIYYETESALVFYDINPKNKTHLLIIPKMHLKNMKEIDYKSHKDFCKDLFLLIQKISTNLSDEQSFKLVCNNEAQAGQVVFHLHWHFLSDNSLNTL